MNISEVFYSIQGEGTHMGMPAVFIRLAGCDLKCRWCDTKYAWEETDDPDTSFSSLLIKVKKEVGLDRVPWIITGGEPTLQLGEVEDLLRRGLSHYSAIHIETAGHVPVPPKVWSRFNHIVCSPKLSSSEAKTSTDYAQILRENFEFRSQSTTMEWKFVIKYPADIDEALALLNEVRRHIDPVVFQPCTDPEAMSLYDLVEEVKRRRLVVRVMPRLHIQLYGNKRSI